MNHILNKKHLDKEAQKAGKRQLSYRQIIFFCLGGLMGVLTLIFFVYAYYDFHGDCRDSALREARSTAERIADWTDGFFTVSGPGDAQELMSVWEQGVRERTGPDEGGVILNGQGETVFSTNPGLNEICKKIADGNAESRIFENGGGIYLAVGISASESPEWTCYIFRDVRAEAENYRFPMRRFLLWLLFMGISLLVTAWLIYRPIDRLIKSVGRETGKKAQRKNELEFISGSFHELKDDSQKLKKMMLQKQDKLQEMFTMRLIRGDITRREEYDEYVKDFHLYSWKCFVTIVAVLNLREEEDTQSNIKEDAICLQIVEEMTEDLKCLAWMPPVYNACTIVAILGGDEDEQLLGRIKEYCTKLQEFSENVCGYRLLMGVSAAHNNPRHINMAYRESINALTRSGSVRQDVGGEEITNCYFYLTGLSSSEMPYDASYEKQMQLGIKNMDKAQCYKAANDFFGYLKEENYSQEELMIYVLRFVDTILLTAMELRVDVEAMYPDGLRRVYDELMEVLEPSRERRYIKKNLVDPILEARRELMEKRSYSLLEDIEQLIHEKKGDISLAECAEILGVHTTYIWKILKTERGKTFSDFLEEYKLDEAKRLLLNTNMTVAEIASALNYTNAQNFIRFFSKSTGMTPGKFRKLY